MKAVYQLVPWCFLFLSCALNSTMSACGLSAVQAAQAPAPPGNSLTAKPSDALRLEDGTPVKLRLQRTMSSADAHVDERVDFDVLEEVKIKDIVVISKGSVAWGTVTEAQSKRRMARGGKLDINIDAVRIADGEKAALRATKGGSGGGHTGAMTGAIVATSIVFFPAAPFFLFMHGKDITIPKGTEITAYVNGDFNIDLAKFQKSIGSESQAGQAAPVAVAPPAIAATSIEVNSVLVKSTPDGADITVDGKYVGSTPSTLKLAAGDHAVTVEMAGFKTWQRTITVTSGGEVSINATLEKAP